MFVLISLGLFLSSFTLQFTISSTTTIKSVSLSKFASSLKTPLPSADPTRYVISSDYMHVMHALIMHAHFYTV